MSTSTTFGSHAIVIGGSMAGALTARLLTDHFTHVTLIERDPYVDTSEPRKGVPQARHAHAVMARGFQIMSGLFPNLPKRLEAAGTLRSDMGSHTKMYYFGGYKIPTQSGIYGTMMTRGLLDQCIRQELALLPNLTIRSGYTVEGVLATQDGSRILGVQLKGNGEDAALEDLTADFVVDSTGRGSQSPKWLELLGYERPIESKITVNVGYATREYSRSVPDSEAKAVLIAANAPDTRLGVLIPIEGKRWILTLAGTLGDYPPTDDAGFIAFARSLPDAEIATLIEGEQPVSETVQFRFPANFRRHYEKLSRFPEGYLVIGDAICSFNPIYGQGMTSSALQVEALQQLLAKAGTTLQGIGLTYFRHAAPIVDGAWQMATGEDFRYPQVEGERPAGTGFLHAYIEWVHRTTQVDPVVHTTFLKVMNMVETPAALMTPGIALRVLRHRLFGKKGSPRRANVPQPIRSMSKV